MIRAVVFCIKVTVEAICRASVRGSRAPIAGSIAAGDCDRRLAQALDDPSLERKIRRWRKGGLLPSTVPSGRYHNDFPRHAAEQVRAIIGLLECQRSLRYVAIGLFLLGHQVRKTTLRTAFGALAQGKE